MPNQSSEAPPCTRCGQHRDANVHIANLSQAPYANYHPYTNATKVVVTFTRQVADDTRDADLSYLQQEYKDVVDPVQRQKYMDDDAARLAAYNRGDWRMIGIRARATVQVQRPGYTTLYEMESPGLWGVEDDSAEDYLNQVFEDEKSILKHDIEAIMSAPLEWK